MRDGIGCFIQLFWAIVWWMGGMFALQYDLNYWITFFEHHSVNVPLLPCAIGAIFCGGPAILVWVITVIFG